MRYIGGIDSGDAYVYEGWFVNGLPQGHGRKIDMDGTIYTGKFKFGLEDGEGHRISKRMNTQLKCEEVVSNEKGLFAFGMFQKELLWMLNTIKYKF